MFRLFGDEIVEDEDDEDYVPADGEDDDENDSGSETLLANGRGKRPRSRSRGSRGSSSTLPTYHNRKAEAERSSGLMGQISNTIGGIFGRQRKGSMRGDYNSLGGPNDS